MSLPADGMRSTSCCTSCHASASASAPADVHLVDCRESGAAVASWHQSRGQKSYPLRRLEFRHALKPHHVFAWRMIDRPNTAASALADTPEAPSK